MKNIFKGIVAHHLWRHRQHRRFMRSLAVPMLALGRTKGMLLLGAIALGAEYFRRKRKQELPEHLD